MQELYIIRHGLAGKKLEDIAKDDQRPLKKKGIAEMKGIAKGLKGLKISFDRVFTSPLVRSKETAEIVNTHCSHTKEVTVTPLLSPDASFKNLIEFLNTFKDLKTVAIVGHEPFLSCFASYCLSKNENPLMYLKKGGILMLKIDGVISPGRCLLAWLMEPEQMIRKVEQKRG